MQSPAKVWIVVEECHETQCDEDYNIKHVCASRDGALTRLKEDSAFFANLSEHTESETRYTGKQGAWYYKFYIKEMDVES